MTVVSASHDSVTLTWNNPGDDTIGSYQILRRSRDGSEYGDGLGAAVFVVVDSTGSSATSYTDTSVTAGTRYVYRVKARNSRGLSVVSSYANAETPHAPPEALLPEVPGSRPNVVLILADDLGWGDIQSNNPDSAMTTPRIDSIAASGANFTDAHSPSASCSPTRYGLLTGRYAWRTWLTSGVLNGYDRPLVGPDRPTLGTLLQHHGYRTAAVGKWHLGMEFASLSDVDEVTELNRGIDLGADIADSPIDHGFDEFFGTSANLSWRVPVYIRNNRFVANLDAEDQPESGFIRAKEVLDRLTAEAVSFIDRATSEDDPFFLYLPLNAPHEPLAPSTRFEDSTELGSYGDFVAQIDSTVGQVLDALDQAGVRDDTLVIFTSDNGSFMRSVPNHVAHDHISDHRKYKYRVGTHRSNGDWRMHKGSIYEGGHRVPFLLQWPSVVEADSTVDATVSLTDLYATLADSLGEEPEPGVAIDSVSLLPLLQGEAATRGVPAVHHSSGGDFAIRDGRWKLVLHTPRELYDLEQNPEEQNNVAGAHPDVVARLRTALERIRSAEDATLSGDATLRALTLGGIDIGPFSPEVRTYTATVARRVEAVEVLALPTATDAVVKIRTHNGQLLYGRPDRGRVEVGLGDSDTDINVYVAAPDGDTRTSYKVTVTRVDEVPAGPVITGTPTVGETLTVDTSGITDADGLDSPGYSYQWTRDDGRTDSDIVGATGSTYTLTAEDEGKTIGVRVDFTDDAGNAETRTSAATVEAQPALTAELGRVPGSHDGSETFIFRVLFSEPVTVGFQTLRDHSFEVSNGVIKGTRRVDGRNDLREIKVQPSTDAAVVLVLPTTADCDAQGAVCTSDGKRLSSRLEVTVPGSAPADTVWESELTAGENSDDVPAVSGYSFYGGLGTLSPNRLEIDDTTYRVMYLVHTRESLWLGMHGALPADFTVRVGNSTYRGSESAVTRGQGATGLYWWASAPPDWSSGDPVQVSLTVHTGVPLGSRQPAPVTGYFRSFPAEHDGSEEVSFRIYFSEGVATTADVLRDHVLAVSGGAVSNVEDVWHNGKIWAVSITPDSTDTDTVTVEIEAGLDCDLAGAICAADGRRLFNRMELTVPGEPSTVDEPAPEHLGGAVAAGVVGRSRSPWLAAVHRCPASVACSM